VGIKEFKKGIGEATRDGKDKGEADRSPEADERDRGPTA
jgi:hypothetical protein